MLLLNTNIPVSSSARFAGYRELTTVANSKFLQAVLKTRKRFEALRSFTLESGQEEIERLAQLQKESSDSPEHISSPARSTRNGSVDSLRSPSSARSPSLSDVPEEGGTFSIGDDDDSEDDDHDLQTTPSQSSPSAHDSRSPSMDSVDDAVPMQLRGMSEKARGKMPVGQTSFSRVNSMSSISSHTAPVVSTSSGFTPSAHWVSTTWDCTSSADFTDTKWQIDSWLPSLPLHTILTLLSSTESTTPPKTIPPQIDPFPPRIQLFEWSPLSLGWYESLLWSFIFASEMMVQKGTVGVWNGTGIKLFKVEKEAAKGPSLMKPMGAVDAVGSNLVSRIGSLNLRGASAAQGAGT